MENMETTTGRTQNSRNPTNGEQKAIENTDRVKQEGHREPSRKKIERTTTWRTWTEPSRTCRADNLADKWRTGGHRKHE